jgi:general secretion pathway protein K
MNVMPRSPEERGYALIAAVASIAVFASIALAVISATRIDIAKGHGEISSVRARLAAEAGMAIAVHGLMNRETATLALLDGRTQELEFSGARLAITMMDERSKVALNFIDAPVIERMLNEAGLDTAQMEIARDSLLDWQDADDETLRNGAEAPFYAKRGITPRNGFLQSIDELGMIRGFTPQIVDSLRPFVTVEPDAVPFSPRYAGAKALAAIGDSQGAVTEIERTRESAGQRTAIAFVETINWIGRPITISVEATTPDHGRYHMSAIVEVTGKPAHPYVIRRTS